MLIGFIIVIATPPTGLHLYQSYHNSTVDELNSINGYVEYTLTDKVIKSYGTGDCKSLTARSMSQPISQSSATFYLLSGRPLLANNYEHFDISESATFNDDQMTDQRYDTVSCKYLNNGSYVSLNACYANDTSQTVEFYLIKGSERHKKWVKNPLKTYAVYYEKLTSKCQMIGYHVQEDDIYYFSFYTNYSLTFTLNIDFHFNRTVYHVSEDNIVQNCSFPLDGHSGCSLSVPMSSGYTALLSLNTTLPVNYNDRANIKLDCQPHGWLYAVVVVGSVFVVGITIIVLILACICLRKKKQAKYSPLTHSRSVNTSNSARYGATSDRNRASS